MATGQWTVMIVYFGYNLIHILFGKLSIPLLFPLLKTGGYDSIPDCDLQYLHGKAPIIFKLLVSFTDGWYIKVVILTDRFQLDR